MFQVYAYKVAFDSGVALRKALDKFTQEQSEIVLSGLVQLRSMILNSIDSMKEESPESIKIFLERADVLFLFGLESRKAIVDKVEQIMTVYIVATVN